MVFQDLGSGHRQKTNNLQPWGEGDGVARPPARIGEARRGSGTGMVHVINMRTEGGRCSGHHDIKNVVLCGLEAPKWKLGTDQECHCVVTCVEGPGAGKGRQKHRVDTSGELWMKPILLEMQHHSSLPFGFSTGEPGQFHGEDSGAQRPPPNKGGVEW